MPTYETLMTLRMERVDRTRTDGLVYEWNGFIIQELRSHGNLHMDYNYSLIWLLTTIPSPKYTLKAQLGKFNGTTTQADVYYSKRIKRFIKELNRPHPATFERLDKILKRIDTMTDMERRNATTNKKSKTRI